MRLLYWRWRAGELEAPTLPEQAARAKVSTRYYQRLRNQVWAAPDWQEQADAWLRTQSLPVQRKYRQFLDERKRA